jgi:hypothetical protein
VARPPTGAELDGPGRQGIRQPSVVRARRPKRYGAAADHDAGLWPAAVAGSQPGVQGRGKYRASSMNSRCCGVRSPGRSRTGPTGRAPRPPAWARRIWLSPPRWFDRRRDRFHRLTRHRHRASGNRRGPGAAARPRIRGARCRALSRTSARTHRGHRPARREAGSRDDQLTVRAAKERLCARLLSRLETAADLIYTDNPRALGYTRLSAADPGAGVTLTIRSSVPPPFGNHASPAHRRRLILVLCRGSSRTTWSFWPWPPS